MSIARRHLFTLCVAACVLFCALAANAYADTGTTGGASPDDPQFKPVGKAKLIDGVAYPPADAPPEVVGAIEAANRIITKPYRYGGGHRSFEDTGYDCSGSVSYALNGGGLLDSPLDSSSFMRWGERGKGRWITVYTNPGHAYMVIAGLRLDTGGRDRYGARGRRAGSGPRWGGWRSARGYSARHPLGL